MKNKKMKTVIVSSLLASTISLVAFADYSDGFKLTFNLFFGKESEKSDSKSCRNFESGGGGSVLQGVNAFFCQLEKSFGITQVPTTGKPVSVTKVYKGRTVHVELSGEAGGGAQIAAGFNDDGSLNSDFGYDYLAKIWVCKASGSVTCANVTDFKAAVAIAYSYKADGSINQGNMLQDPSAREGLGGGAAISIIYNNSTKAASKKIVVKHLKENGDKMRLDGLTVSGILSVQVIHDQASAARRFSTRVDIAGHTATSSFVQSIALADNSVAADPAQCFNRNDDGAGDWSYSVMNGGTCTVDGYTDSVSAVNAYTFNSIMKAAPSDLNWSNGMTPTPVTL